MEPSVLEAIRSLSFGVPCRMNLGTSAVRKRASLKCRDKTVPTSGSSVDANPLKEAKISVDDKGRL
jgi:hypothetical protein